MIRALLLLVGLLASTVVNASPPPQSPASGASGARWESFAANPEWEVFGAEDPAGVFRYTDRRRKLPVLNYGVNLSHSLPTAGTPLVLGNDPETSRMLMRGRQSAVLTGPPKSLVMGASAKAKPCTVCGSSDCDGGDCPFRKKPKPPRPIDIDLTPHFEFQPIHAVFALVGLCLFLAFWCVVVILCVVAYRLTRRAVSTPPSNPQ